MLKFLLTQLAFSCTPDCNHENLLFGAITSGIELSNLKKYCEQVAYPRKPEALCLESKIRLVSDHAFKENHVINPFLLMKYARRSGKDESVHFIFTTVA